MRREGREGRRLRAIAAAVILVAVASCAPTETRIVRVIDTATLAPHPWVGKPESLVLERWGAGPLRESDGHGGWILSYEGKAGRVSVEATRETGGVGRRAPTGEIDPPPSPFATERVAAPPKHLARFWIDAQGRVYRVWFARSIYDDGRDAPDTENPAGGS